MRAVLAACAAAVAVVVGAAAPTGAVFIDSAMHEDVVVVETAELPALDGVVAAIDTGNHVGFMWQAPELPDGADIRYRLTRTADGRTETFQPETAAFGSIVLGQEAVVVPAAFDPARLSHISTGFRHTCGIGDGAVYCWGSNSYGELGTGFTGPGSPVPVKVDGLLEGKEVTAIDAGDAFTCAIADGEVYCWGSDASGQLGDGESDASAQGPVAVTPSWGAAEVTAIDAGGDAAACAIAGGDVYCWGSGARTQLGDGGNQDRSVPTAVRRDRMGDAVVTDIALNAYGACAVADGELYCWGRNYASWGDGWTGVGKSIPFELSASSPLHGLPITGLAGAEQRFCAVAAGAAYCWGLGGAVHLGVAASLEPSPRPLPTALNDPGAVLTGRAFTEVAMGFYAACVYGDGLPVCWGDSYAGSTGTGVGLVDEPDRYVMPAPLSTASAALSEVTDLDLGMTQGCLMAEQGLACWGYRGSGGLFGDGETDTIALSPVLVDLSDTLGDPVCSAGWLPGNGGCVPATGTSISYTFGYTVHGWASPLVTRTVSWAEDAG